MSDRRIRSLLGSMLLVGIMLTISAAAPKAFAATQKTTNSALPASAYTTCPSTQQQGSRGTWVTVLQYRLNELSRERAVSFGSLLATDGSFGSLTANAVYQYQVTMKLAKHDKVVGPETWGALGFCVSSGIPLFDVYPHSATSCPPLLANGSTGTWVVALQSLLNTLYYYSDDYQYGDPLPDAPRDFHPPLALDGSFGTNTTNAVWDFQNFWHNFNNGDHFPNFSVDGKVGPQTWSALRMC